MNWYYMKALLAEEERRLQQELAPIKAAVAEAEKLPKAPACAKGDWANCLKCAKLGSWKCPHERRNYK